MNKFTLMVIGGIALSFITSINAFAKNEYEQDKQGKGLPPGLQKKVDRGEPLLPVGRKNSAVEIFSNWTFITEDALSCR